MRSPTAEGSLAAVQSYIGTVARSVPLRSAVLDAGPDHPRIVYDAACVEHCPTSCESCALFRAVTALPAAAAPRGAELVPDDPDRLARHPDRQRCANCKTLDQYLEGLVTDLVESSAPAEVEAQVDRVHGMRLLHAQGVSDLAGLERLAQRVVVREAIVRLGHGDWRGMIIAGAARRAGLIG